MNNIRMLITDRGQKVEVRMVTDIVVVEEEDQLPGKDEIEGKMRSATKINGGNEKKRDYRQ